MSDGLGPRGTDLRSSHTCTQHLAIASATQCWQALPKPGHARGWVGRQTDRLCCLAQTRLRDRRLRDVWWLPELIYQSPPFQTLKALWRCHRYHPVTSKLTNRRRRWGNGGSLVYGLVPLEWTRPLTWKSSHQNCEAGSRTTLETKIVWGGGGHEISGHLLWCLNPMEMVLKEILTILFAVSALWYTLEKLCTQSLELSVS